MRTIAVPAKAFRRNLPKDLLKSLLIRDAGPGIDRILRERGGEVGKLGVSTVIQLNPQGAVAGSSYYWSGVLSVGVPAQLIWNEVPPIKLEIQIPEADIEFPADSDGKNMSAFLDGWSVVERAFINDVAHPIPEVKKQLGEFCIRLVLLPRSDTEMSVFLKVSSLYWNRTGICIDADVICL